VRPLTLAQGPRVIGIRKYSGRRFEEQIVGKSFSMSGG